MSAEVLSESLTDGICKTRSPGSNYADRFEPEALSLKTSRIVEFERF
jgi:hypothetical protein